MLGVSSIRSRCNYKQVCIASAYIWPGGHIYCSASAIASKLALLSVSAYIRRRFACRIYCSRLGRARMLLYCAAISYTPECECAFWHMTYIRSRCNYKQVCIASAYIWPSGHIYCSRLGRARMLLVYCAAISYIPECECAFRHMTSIRSRCNYKQVCIACVSSYMQLRFSHSGVGYCRDANIFALLSVSAYIRRRFACRIYCSRLSIARM